MEINETSISGRTYLNINENKNGTVNKTKKTHSEGDTSIPKEIPIRELVTEKQYDRFKTLYKNIFSELDFCTTCPSAIRWAAKRLNNFYGYK